ncbi:hypothetical protein SHKM778_42710 [Streptomyces sp. KM77-8]|uniref:Uncharacterized protein n=1 Tax=Streptomyces haneummycinicus TaxID=3074435 RepID=A0AAT9HKT2_9ACTN
MPAAAQDVEDVRLGVAPGIVCRGTVEDVDGGVLGHGSPGEDEVVGGDMGVEPYRGSYRRASSIRSSMWSGFSRSHFARSGSSVANRRALVSRTALVSREAMVMNIVRW